MAYKSYAEIGQRVKADYPQDAKITVMGDDELGKLAYQKHPEEYPDFTPETTGPAVSAQPPAQQSMPTVEAPLAKPYKDDMDDPASFKKRSAFDIPVSEYLGEAYKAGKQGLVESGISMVRGAGDLIQSLPTIANYTPARIGATIADKLTGNKNSETPEIVKKGLQSASESVRGGADYIKGEFDRSQMKKDLAPAKDFENGWTRKIGQGLSSTVSLGAMALINPPTAVAAAVAMGAGEVSDDIDEYEKKTGTKVSAENRAIATGLGGIVGSVDSYVPGKIFGPLKVIIKHGTGIAAEKASKAAMEAVAKTHLEKSFARHFAESAIVESGQEGFQQLSENLIARHLYNKDKSPMENVIEAAMVGLFTAGIMDGSIGGAGRLVLKRMVGKSQADLHTAQVAEQAKGAQASQGPQEDIPQSTPPPMTQQAAPTPTGATPPPLPAQGPAPTGAVPPPLPAQQGTPAQFKGKDGKVYNFVQPNPAKPQYQIFTTDDDGKPQLVGRASSDAARDAFFERNSDMSALQTEADKLRQENARLKQQREMTQVLDHEDDTNAPVTDVSSEPPAEYQMPEGLPEDLHARLAGVIQKVHGLKEKANTVEAMPDGPQKEQARQEVAQEVASGVQEMTEVGQQLKDQHEGGGTGNVSMPETAGPVEMPQVEDPNEIPPGYQRSKVGDMFLEPTAEPTEEEMKFKNASTQVNITGPTANKILKAGSQIAESDLVGQGREQDPHITVQYAIPTDDDIHKIKDALAGVKPFTVTVGENSIFPDSGDGEVVKADVQSPELHKVKQLIQEVTGAQDTHPEYNPHVTLGYVAPGAGAKYSGKSAATGSKIKVTSIAFSDKNGNHIEIPLGTDVKKAPRKPRVETSRPSMMQDVVPQLAPQVPVYDPVAAEQAAMSRPEVQGTDPNVMPQVQMPQAAQGPSPGPQGPQGPQITMPGEPAPAPAPTNTPGPIHAPIRQAETTGPVESQERETPPISAMPAGTFMTGDGAAVHVSSSVDASGEKVFKVTDPGGTSTQMDDVDFISWAADNLAPEHVDAAMKLAVPDHVPAKRKGKSDVLADKKGEVRVGSKRMQVDYNSKEPPSRIDSHQILNAMLGQQIMQNEHDRIAAEPDYTTQHPNPMQSAKALMAEADDSTIHDAVKPMDLSDITVGVSNLLDIKDPALRPPSAAEIKQVLDQMIAEGLVQQKRGRGRNNNTYMFTAKGVANAVGGASTYEIAKTTGPVESKIPDVSEKRRTRDAGKIPINVAQVRASVQANIDAFRDRVRNFGDLWAVFARSTESYLQHRYETEGRIFTELIKNAKMIGEIEGGKALHIMDRAGLRNKKLWDNPQAMQDLHDVLTGRKAVSDIEGVMTLAAAMRKVTDAVADRAIALKIQVTSPSGKRLPFAKHANYIPITYNHEAMKTDTPIRRDVIHNMISQGWVADEAEALGLIKDTTDYMTSEKGMGSAPHSLMEWAEKYGGYHGKTQGQIAQSLARYRAAAKMQDPGAVKNSSLEYMRKTRLPTYDPNMLRVLPANALSTHARLKIIEAIGQDDQVAKLLVQHAGARGTNTNQMSKDFQKLLGQQVSVVDWLNTAMAFGRQVVTFRLGFATFPNSLQTINTWEVTDTGTFLGAHAEAYGPAAQDLAVESGAISETILNEAIHGYSHQQTLGKWSTRMLKANGFTGIEMNNRRMSAVAGVKWMTKNLEIIKDAARAAGATSVEDYIQHYPASMAAKDAHMILNDFYHFDTKRITEMADMGVTKDEELIAAKKMSDYTQFRSDISNVPIWSSTPAGKMIWMFKHFAYNQAKFRIDRMMDLYDGVKSGNLRQMNRGAASLAKILFGSTSAGLLILQLKYMLTHGGDRREFKDLATMIWESFTAAGPLGMFTDMYAATWREDHPGWAIMHWGMGPVLGATVDAIGIGAKAGEHAVTDPVKLGGDAYRAINTFFPIFQPVTHLTKSWLEDVGAHPQGTIASQFRGRAQMKSGIARTKIKPAGKKTVNAKD